MAKKSIRLPLKTPLISQLCQQTEAGLSAASELFALALNGVEPVGCQWLNPTFKHNNLLWLLSWRLEQQVAGGELKVHDGMQQSIERNAALGHVRLQIDTDVSPIFIDFIQPDESPVAYMKLDALFAYSFVLSWEISAQQILKRHQITAQVFDFYQWPQEEAADKKRRKKALGRTTKQSPKTS